PDGVLKDTAAAYVVQQRPDRFDENKAPMYIQSGQLMDVWISQIMKVAIDSTTTKKNELP
ncbi:MAG TPA: hypothetical protein PK987_05845, partial [Ferruginibacter sp.]|nr:hypothetical protein [Ferruginibacter sp.]